MTVNSQQFKDDFDSLLEFGEIVRFKYYTESFTGSYDDDITLTQSGADLFVSGVTQPITNKQFSSEALLLEQGKILLDDRKLYVAGEVQTSGASPIKIGMSGTSQEYQILEEGQITQWDINSDPVYKKVYIRFLPNGSFIGE